MRIVLQYFHMDYSKCLIFKKSYVNAWRTYWQDKTNYLYFFLNLALLLLAWSSAYIIFNNLGDELLVFHYTVDFGIDSIAKANNIFIIPLFASIISFINFKFKLLVAREPLKGDYYHLLGAGTLVLNIIILLSLMSIYLSNFYA